MPNSKPPQPFETWLDLYDYLASANPSIQEGQTVQLPVLSKTPGPRVTKGYSWDEIKMRAFDELNAARLTTVEYGDFEVAMVRGAELAMSQPKQSVVSSLDKISRTIRK